MGTYVLTGGATGIGAAIKEKLRAQGHRVVIIDLKEGDYLADLGDPKARKSVITKVATEVPVIDGPYYLRRGGLTVSRSRKNSPD
jgi:NAD(P)-dependent dehydrogenase (short-subunit alcohol dehydrogenase family)